MIPCYYYGLSTFLARFFEFLNPVIFLDLLWYAEELTGMVVFLLNAEFYYEEENGRSIIGLLCLLSLYPGSDYFGGSLLINLKLWTCFS